MAEIELRASRSSGPGGQHANVTESKIEAIFDVFASGSLDPVQKARISAKVGPRLARRIEEALRVPRSRTKTKPTAGSKRRRLETKRQRSETKKGRRRPSDDG